jgi:hypothetical protein
MKKWLSRKFAPVWLVEICLTENHPAGANHFEEIFQEFWSSGYRARTFGETSREVTAGDVARWTSTGHRDFGGSILFSNGPMKSMYRLRLHSNQRELRP